LAEFLPLNAGAAIEVGYSAGGANMLTTLMPFLLLSPSLMVEFSIDRKVFPEGVDDWDRIGLFKLKDGDEDRVVLLYCYDSDSVTEKRMAKHGIAPLYIPE
jgi:hypothetical protein